jgi:hypothetical protein
MNVCKGLIQEDSMKKPAAFSLFKSFFLGLFILGNCLCWGHATGDGTGQQKSARGRGVVRGLVVNQHHKPLSQVQIQLKHITPDDYPLVLTAVSNNSGRWSIAGVGNVQWTVEASRPGYHPCRLTLRTSNFSDKIPLVQTVLRKIVREEMMGLADLDYITFGSSEKLASAIVNDDADKIKSFINNHKDKIDRDFYIALGNCSVDHERFTQAMTYYQKAAFKRGANRIGDYYFKNNRLQKALVFYQKGIPSENRALAFRQKADQFLKINDRQQGKKYLLLAHSDFDSVIKNCTFSWKKESNQIRRKTIVELETFPKTPAQLARKKKLAKLLKGAAHYCHLLDNSSLYFYCHEVVVERSSLPREELYPAASKLTSESKLKGWQNRTNRFLYDYQLIKEGESLRERRHLLKMNGRRMRRKNVPLTTIYQISRNISGPIGLISKAWQPHTDYRIVDEKKIGQENITVIQCFPTAFREKNHLFGEVWIRDRDFRIIKIVWYPFSIGNRNAIESLARLFKRTPRVTFISEYGVYKSGIQFPSKCLVKEEYLSPSGDSFTRILITYEYKRYRFFKVQTSVKTLDPEEK